MDDYKVKLELLAEANRLEAAEEQVKTRDTPTEYDQEQSAAPAITTPDGEEDAVKEEKVDTRGSNQDDSPNCRRYPQRENKPRHRTPAMKEEQKPQIKVKKRRRRYDSETEELACFKCKFTSTSRTGLLNHIRMHQTTRKFTCALCQKIFDTNEELIKHKSVHDDEEHMFMCKRCQSAYSNHLDFLLHNLTHSRCETYRCEECSKTFTNKFSLKGHIEIHFDISYKCDVCGHVLKTERAYKNHVKIHNDSTEYRCGECGKVCKCSKTLKYHMVVHTGVKPYQCLYCGKGYTTNTAKLVHMRTHSDERPYECKTCSQKFRQQTDLFRHMESHVKKKTIECQICNKKFRHKASLQQHMRSHTGENLISCLECDHKSASLQALRTHVIYKHTTDTPFRCDLCNFECKTKQALTRHYNRLSHRNMVYVSRKRQKKENDENDDHDES